MVAANSGQPAIVLGVGRKSMPHGQLHLCRRVDAYAGWRRRGSHHVSGNDERSVKVDTVTADDSATAFSTSDETDRERSLGGRRLGGDWVAIAFDGSRDAAPRTKSNERAYCAADYGNGKTARSKKNRNGKGRSKGQARGKFSCRLRTSGSH